MTSMMYLRRRPRYDLFRVRPQIEQLETRCLLATFVVTTSNNSGSGSLRQAILNANNNPGLDAIHFNMIGPKTVSPTSALPDVSGPTIIDGTTQPGYSGVPIIELNGSNAGNTNGLRLIGGNSAVYGLIVNRFKGDGILIQNAGNNLIAGNYIGTDNTGMGDLGNTGGGVSIYNAPNNVIGGTTAGARNVISGNGITGVFIFQSGAAGNVVLGNFVGTNAAGSGDLGNGGEGVHIQNAPNNVVGGIAAGARNVIAGNVGAGVLIFLPGSSGNVVQGNYIGTDITGTTAIGNGFEGVRIEDAPGNTIGGTLVEARNLISGNDRAGVLVFLPGASGNVMQGNYIGTDFTGITAIANGGEGVAISRAADNTVGGTENGARNLISGNERAGVLIDLSSSSGNLVQGNYIGTDVTGVTAIANGGEGVKIADAPDNAVGGTPEAARNLISGNVGAGVLIYLPGASGNLVQGNYIGTDVSGTRPVGNADGVHIQSAPNNLVGGTTPRARNLISGNRNGGVVIFLPDAMENKVQGNYIGTDVSGRKPLGNGTEGIHIERAPGNMIGGTTPEVRNLISGNAHAGLAIYFPESTQNVIQGNYFGTDVSGIRDLGNKGDGIVIKEDASNNAIGGSAVGSGNTIAFNANAGIVVGSNASDTAVGNAIQRNSIFANRGLAIDLANDGVTPIHNCGSPSGPNQLQNLPVTQAVAKGSATEVRGIVNGRPGVVYTLEFFASKFVNSSGFGDGQRFVGEASIATGGDCLGIYDLFFSGISANEVVTVTATDSAGNTSEFSNAVIVQDINVHSTDAHTFKTPSVVDQTLHPLLHFVTAQAGRHCSSCNAESDRLCRAVRKAYLDYHGSWDHISFSGGWS